MTLKLFIRRKIEAFTELTVKQAELRHVKGMKEHEAISFISDFAKQKVP